jgi:hypothetical protein
MFKHKSLQSNEISCKLTEKKAFRKTALFNTFSRLMVSAKKVHSGFDIKNGFSKGEKLKFQKKIKHEHDVYKIPFKTRTKG